TKKRITPANAGTIAAILITRPFTVCSINLANNYARTSELSGPCSKNNKLA
ncbi:29152_t:CDS:1, partial [Racocetra persica]